MLQSPFFPTQLANKSAQFVGTFVAKYWQFNSLDLQMIDDNCLISVSALVAQFCKEVYFSICKFGSRRCYLFFFENS